MKREITDEVCLAALRGWCGWPRDAPLSGYQQADYTKEAWRRAINAALDEMERLNAAVPQGSEAPMGTSAPNTSGSALDAALIGDKCGLGTSPQR